PLAVLPHPALYGLGRGLESRFRSISRIACMPEIIGSFAGSEGTRESADPAAQARNCSFCGLAQIGLELAERHLDRVQVRRVFGQIAKRRTARFDRLADTGGLVRRKIVDHDDILALEGRGETPLDIGQELLSSH